MLNIDRKTLYNKIKNFQVIAVDRLAVNKKATHINTSSGFCCFLARSLTVQEFFLLEPSGYYDRGS
jgi:hypothetical protein